MNDVCQLLVETIVSLPSQQVICVGIDGIDAAGKSTLAKSLVDGVEALGRPAVYASIDGFHHPKNYRYRKGKMSPDGYFEDSFNYQLLRSVLLDPLKITGGSFDELPVAVFNHHKNKENSGVKAKFTPETILVFEGIFLFRPEINAYWDYRIYIDIAFKTSVERGISCYSGSEESNAVRLSYENRYVPGQKIYLQAVKPKTKADVIINNDDPEFPVLTFSD